MKTTMQHAVKNAIQRDFVSKKLTALGVVHDDNGTPIAELTYRELKYLLVITRLRKGL